MKKVLLTSLILIMMRERIEANEWSLSVKGKRLVKSMNETDHIQLRCASWYGTDQKDFVVGGLDIQRAESIAYLAKNKLQLNCIRLPIAVETYIKDPILRLAAISKHAEFNGFRALDVLDAIISILGNQGLRIILDVHTLSADWCCDAYDGNGLWYNKNFTENDWLRTLSGLAQRYYQSSPQVIGIELRNEIRPSDALGNGNLLYPTWGTGYYETDWGIAAIRGAKAVHSINRPLLIIVGGIDFGLDLSHVASFPLHHEIPRDKLVYSIHEYFWSCPDCDTYQNYARHLNRTWGFIHFDAIGPVFLSEFGTVHHSGIGFETNNVEYTTAGKEAFFSSDLPRWWHWFMTYLHNHHRGISFSYWPLDGTQSPGRSRVRGAEETYGLLDFSWSKVASQGLLTQIHSLYDDLIDTKICEEDYEGVRNAC